MKNGIIQRQDLTALQSVAASVALVDVGAAGNLFSVPVLAGVTYHFRVHCPFTVGAAGGFRFRLEVPAVTSYVNAQIVQDGVTASPGATICTVITAEADFTAAFAAVAGNHLMTMEGSITPSAAGDMKLQFACNNAAGQIDLLQGGWFEVVTL